MGLFKLPVITIGGTAKDGGGGPEGAEGEEGQPHLDAVGGDSLRKTEDRPKSAARLAKIPEIKNGWSYQGEAPLFLEVAKETIARCIQAGIFGDATARDFFRNYSAYLSEVPPGEPVEDFLFFATKNNAEQHRQMSSILNSSLEYPLTRLEVDPSLLVGGAAGVLEGDLAQFCRRFNTPLISASGHDLMLFGVCNPLLTKYISDAMDNEVGGVEFGYRYYALITPEQILDIKRITS